jgi:heme/copper-type cytochrome/quinol oxidase subunit 3
MSSEVQSVKHSSDEIHLPPPSWGPMVLALGATLIASSILFWPMLLLGVIIFFVGISKVSSFSILDELRTSMGVHSRMLGMWVFLASEIMFFSGLIATFLGYRARTGDAAGSLNVPLMTVGTFLLLTSSLAAVSALSAIQNGKTTAFRNWIIATMVLGALFLGVELTEWSELIGHGITTGTLFGSAFFTLTGFHGIHVLIGLAWMSFLLARTVRGKMATGSAMGIEVFGLYWHFVDIVWIILFTIIYLL